MLVLNDEKNILEGELKLSDCEREYVVRWLSGSSQASFFIGDEESTKLEIRDFISGKHICKIELDSFLNYLKTVKLIIEKYKSMYYGPFDNIDKIIARFSLMKPEDAKVVLFYEYPDRYIRILNNRSNYKENQPIWGDEILQNGDEFRHSYMGGITKIKIQKNNEEYLLGIELIENWRDVLMQENGAKVTLEALINIFNAEMNENLNAGKSATESGQIFGIKYAPLLNNNEKKFSYIDIINGSSFNSDDIKDAVKNGMSISSSVIWASDLLENDNTDVSINKNLPKFDYSLSTIKEGQNLIVYGTPGCGKSYYVEHTLLKDYSKDNYIRTTFFQDYTNTDFVGQILPKVDGDNVTYEFNPGPFTLALEKAIEKPNEKVALVIEEMNRGSAASIFGDIFQLLDRKNGISEYSITNINVINYLNKRFTNKYSFDCIKLPGNFSIFATMNTSDQNVFTLDTAFKRRWNFKKLLNEFEPTHAFKNKYIPGASITWEKFVKDINEYILSTANTLNSEDKQLGVYFVDEKCMRDDVNAISSKKDIEDFAYKVLEYLWSDVAKFDRAKWFNKDIKCLDELVKEYTKSGIGVFNYDVFNK